MHSCTLHSFFDGEDFQVASVSTSFEKENVGFGVSKSTDPVAIELSLESFDASALRMMLQRCWTYYTHYKARLLFDTLLLKSMSPEPPPPFQLEVRDKRSESRQEQLAFSSPIVPTLFAASLLCRIGSDNVSLPFIPTNGEDGILLEEY